MIQLHLHHRFERSIPKSLYITISGDAANPETNIASKTVQKSSNARTHEKHNTLVPSQGSSYIAIGVLNKPQLQTWQPNLSVGNQPTQSNVRGNKEKPMILDVTTGFFLGLLCSSRNPPPRRRHPPPGHYWRTHAKKKEGQGYSMRSAHPPPWCRPPHSVFPHYVITMCLSTERRRCMQVT